MIVEASSQGQTAQAGLPTKGSKTSPTSAEPMQMSVVLDSGSSPAPLISVFQLAWLSAPTRTAAKTRFSKAR
jgi:hypothetical protein